jgi:hypothetical protein
MHFLPRLDGPVVGTLVSRFDVRNSNFERLISMLAAATVRRSSDPPLRRSSNVGLFVMRAVPHDGE